MCVCVHVSQATTSHDNHATRSSPQKILSRAKNSSITGTLTPCVLTQSDNHSTHPTPAVSQEAGQSQAIARGKGFESKVKSHKTSGFPS